MAKTWEEYKQYYLENNGYNSNHIENPNLTKEAYDEYIKQNQYGDKELKDVLTALKNKSKKVAAEIARKEVINFKDAVNKLFDNPTFPFSIPMIENYNFLLMDSFDNEEWGRQFKMLRINGVGKVRYTPLAKGDVDFMYPEFVMSDLEIINKRINRVLSSKTLSLEEKVNEIILYHLNFELIHPFGEGNGRTGRLLMDQQLFKIGLPSLNYKNIKKKDYLFFMGEAQFDLSSKHRGSLFYSSPYEFLKFSWEQLRDSAREVRELGYGGLFKNISKIDYDKVINNITKNEYKIVEDWKYLQYTKHDEYLLEDPSEKRGWITWENIKEN